MAEYDPGNNVYDQRSVPSAGVRLEGYYGQDNVFHGSIFLDRVLLDSDDPRRQEAFDRLETHEEGAWSLPRGVTAFIAPTQAQKVKKKLSIAIEGNIGAGKTTLANIIQEIMGTEHVEILTEPVEEWQNVDGHNLLAEFYKNPEKYAYTFQSYAIVSRLRRQANAQTRDIRVLERSSCSDHCFADNCHASGTMNDVEHAAYKQWWRFLNDHVDAKPDVFLYLRTPAEVCHQRTIERNRKAETGLPLDYLEKLEKRHEDWLMTEDQKDSHFQIPVYVFDGVLNFKNDPAVRNQVKALIHRIAAENGIPNL